MLRSLAITDTADAGAATTKANAAIELPSPVEDNRQIAPVSAGFSSGHMEPLQCGAALDTSTGAASGASCTGKPVGLSAHTIHSPFKDNGTSSTSVARVLNMTVCKF